MLSLEQMHNLVNRLPPPVPNTNITVCSLPSHHALSHSHYQDLNAFKFTSEEVKVDSRAQIQQYWQLVLSFYHSTDYEFNLIWLRQIAFQTISAGRLCSNMSQPHGGATRRRGPTQFERFRILKRIKAAVIVSRAARSLSSSIVEMQSHAALWQSLYPWVKCIDQQLNLRNLTLHKTLWPICALNCDITQSKPIRTSESGDECVVLSIIDKDQWRAKWLFHCRNRIYSARNCLWFVSWRVRADCQIAVSFSICRQSGFNRSEVSFKSSLIPLLHLESKHFVWWTVTIVYGQKWNILSYLHFRMMLFSLSWSKILGDWTALPSF